jgi:RNase P subunit RPR2
MRRTLNNQEERPFNNTIGKLERINELWVEAWKSKINNQTENYYTALECIYISTHPHLSQKEQIDIYAKIKRIERFLDASNTQEKNANQLNRRKGSNMCDELAIELSTLTHKYGLEWLDIKGWREYIKSKEPIVQG